MNKAKLQNVYMSLAPMRVGHAVGAQDKVLVPAVQLPLRGGVTMVSACGG